MTDVVKLGGSLLENRALRASALEAIATSWSSGQRSIVVHGGGKRIDAMLAALDIPKKVQGGLRVTDAETLDVVVSILSADLALGEFATCQWPCKEHFDVER